MNYQELMNELYKNKNDDYALFQKKLSNSDYEVIGIKLPDLKKIAKESYKDESLHLSDFNHHKILEEELMYLYIGMNRAKTIDEKLNFVLENVKYADSWMITDSYNAFLSKLDFDHYIDFFMKTSNSKHIYTRRISYILGLKVIRDERVLSILKYLTDDTEYMVIMGQAWLLATMAICYPNEIYEYLNKSTNTPLIRKTVSKIVDSFRISEENKTMFKTLREKLN